MHNYEPGESWSVHSWRKRFPTAGSKTWRARRNLGEAAAKVAAARAAKASGPSSPVAAPVRACDCVDMKRPATSDL